MVHYVSSVIFSLPSLPVWRRRSIMGLQIDSHRLKSRVAQAVGKHVCQSNNNQISWRPHRWPDPLLSALHFCILLTYSIYLTTLWGKCCYYAFFTERENWDAKSKKIAQGHREQVRKVGSIQTQAVWLWNLLLLPLCHGLCQIFLPRWTLPQNNRFGGRWSNVLYNRKGETQRKTNNKTDLVSHQRKPLPAPALLWMPGFISVVGTREERLVILGMCCLCAWGQSHYGLPFQPEVGSIRYHSEKQPWQIADNPIVGNDYQALSISWQSLGVERDGKTKPGAQREICIQSQRRGKWENFMEAIKQ